MIVGWGLDDAGRACWIVQNSYGESANCHCAVRAELAASGPEAGADLGSGDWLLGPLSRVEKAYAASGLTAKRGCVFVEMVNAELLEAGRNTDLENNVISFVPALDRGVLAGWRSGSRRMRPAGRSAAASPQPASGPLMQDPGLWVVLAVVVLLLVVLRFRNSA
jgi:hypothetical protein